MVAVATTLVDAFCEAAGVRGKKLVPPIDLETLAHRVGAETILSADMTDDGRFVDTPTATRIFLNSTERKERRRFTLAHELGHLVLADPQVLRLVHAALGTRSVNVELLCNAFAAELLMPTGWVEQCFGGMPEDFAAVDALSESADVSMTAALTQLVNVAGWRSSLVYFRRSRDWAPVVIAGPNPRPSRLELEGDAAAVLRSLPEGGKRTWLPLRIRTSSRRLRGQYRPSEGGVLCVGRFTT
jgi:hypothetical protein